MLTRSRGDFDEILDGCDLIVELIGGIEPARDYVLRAMRAGKPRRHRQQAAALASTARSCGRARASTACSCASRPPSPASCPVIRVLQESLAAAHVERVHGIVNGTTNYILTRDGAHRRVLRVDALADAQRLGYAEADPTDDVTGRDAAAKMAILARLAFDTPVHLDQVRYEGIEHITADDIEYARELGLGLKLIGTAERVDGGHLACACTRRSSTRGHPLASVGGPFNAVTIESADDHRDHDVGARRRRPADRERGARRRRSAR